MNGYATTAGTKLFYDNLGTADPATQLAGIDSFTELPKQVADEFETTRVDQEEGTGVHDWFKQFAPDHVDPGQLGVKLAFNKSQISTLYGLVRQFKTWKVLFSDGSKLIVNGFIKEIGQESQDKDEVVVPVLIRLSGKPAFTAAA